MDRRAWQTTVHGAAHIWTRVSNFHRHTNESLGKEWGKKTHHASKWTL